MTMRAFRHSTHGAVPRIQSYVHARWARARGRSHLEMTSEVRSSWTSGTEEMTRTTPSAMERRPTASWRENGSFKQ
eukprot:1494404-Pleurochrysis_carterae.AAC.1